MRRIWFVVALIVGIANVGALLGDDTATTQKDERPSTERPALPKSVDLRPQFRRWNLLPKSQGSRNTCSVFVTTGALEFATSKHYSKGTRLSVEYLNWACNQVIHNQTEDRGQFFHDLLKGFEQHGICFEVNMPYKDHFDPQLKPSEIALKKAQEIQSLGLRIHWINPWKPKPVLSDEHLEQIKSVLVKGYPVGAGSSHSRLLVGYRDDSQRPGGGIFLAKDSGAGAFNEVTYEFVKQKVGDVFWVEASTNAAPTKQ